MVLQFCKITIFFFFFPKDFIYLFIDTERERERQRHRERGKQAPCRECDVGLDPESPGSHPRLQAALNRCATGAALATFHLKKLPVYKILSFDT